MVETNLPRCRVDKMVCGPGSDSQTDHFQIRIRILDNVAGYPCGHSSDHIGKNCRSGRHAHLLDDRIHPKQKVQQQLNDDTVLWAWAADHTQFGRYAPLTLTKVLRDESLGSGL
jgi:hypothetical protein